MGCIGFLQADNPNSHHLDFSLNVKIIVIINSTAQWRMYGPILLPAVDKCCELLVSDGTVSEKAFYLQLLASNPKTSLKYLRGGNFAFL